jgi:hypothetical protein
MPMPIVQSRRHLLTNIAVAGATGFAGLGAAGLFGSRKSIAAEPPPEVSTVRLYGDPVTCLAPEAAEQLLLAEGFTDIRYVQSTDAHASRAATARSGVIGNMLGHDELDFGPSFAPQHIMLLNADRLPHRAPLPPLFPLLHVSGLWSTLLWSCIVCLRHLCLRQTLLLFIDA